MAEKLTERATAGRTRVGVVDADIHNVFPSREVLKSYLPSRWQRHLEMIGPRGHDGYMYASTKYPKVSAATARTDAWPPSGLPPGSDLEFMQEQHLDALNIEYLSLIHI